MSRRLDTLLHDCPVCHVEGAILELVERSEARCRLCGFRTRSGIAESPGRRFLSVAEVEAALAAWAAEEEQELSEFVRQNFLDGEIGPVVDRVLAGEAVATSFDVLGWLLPGLSGGAAVRGPALTESPPPEERRVERRPVPVDPDAARLALCSLAFADGQLHPAEAAWLRRQGIEPLPTPVRRPHELGRPEDPAALVRQMVALALCDGVVDGSEVRLISEFARAWGVPFDGAALGLGGPLRRGARKLFAGVIG